MKKVTDQYRVRRKKGPAFTHTPLTKLNDIIPHKFKPSTPKNGRYYAYHHTHKNISPLININGSEKHHGMYRPVANPFYLFETQFGLKVIESYQHDLFTIMHVETDLSKLEIEFPSNYYVSRQLDGTSHVVIGNTAKGVWAGLTVACLYIVNVVMPLVGTTTFSMDISCGVLTIDQDAERIFVRSKSGELELFEVFGITTSFGNIEIVSMDNCISSRSHFKVEIDTLLVELRRNIPLLFDLVDENGKGTPALQNILSIEYPCGIFNFDEDTYEFYKKHYQTKFDEWSDDEDDDDDE